MVSRPDRSHGHIQLLQQPSRPILDLYLLLRIPFRFFSLLRILRTILSCLRRGTFSVIRFGLGLGLDLRLFGSSNGFFLLGRVPPLLSLLDQVLPG